MRVTSLFNCSIAARNVAIEEVLMDLHNTCHMVAHYGGSRQDVSKTFKK